MRTLGWEPSELELNEMISEIDQDGNGVITFNEFVWFSTKQIMIIENIRAQPELFRDINDDDLENDIREAFRCFDKDALGYIPVPSKIIQIFLVSHSHKHWLLWSLFHLSFAFLGPICFYILALHRPDPYSGDSWREDGPCGD